ncbi:MAG: hypothetical protein RBS39_02540 [Phycisphaerales bacterium]|jgi:hypothetical protein|nr:hypothetical protein [Phycisphaerales bacterium]
MPIRRARFVLEFQHFLIEAFFKHRDAAIASRRRIIARSTRSNVVIPSSRRA